MKSLDGILFEILQQALPDDTRPVEQDDLEKSAAYKRWVPGVRLLLRLRYLEYKRQALEQLKSSLDYTVDNAGVRNLIRQRLAASRSPGLISRFLLSRLTVGLLVVLLAGVGIWKIMQTRQQLHYDQLFGVVLPAWTEAVYLLSAERNRRENSEEEIARLEQDVDAIANEIVQTSIKHVPIKEALVALMDVAGDATAQPKTVLNASSRLNEALQQARLPYYISPTTELSWCRDLPLERFVERMFGGEGGGAEGKTCFTHALLTFTVEEIRQFQQQDAIHPAYFTRRLDRLEISDELLGKVHIGDNKAQILLGNIAGASYGTLTTVDKSGLRSRLMPKGMPDVYGLESLARRLQNRVISGYVSDYHNNPFYRVRSILLGLIGRAPDAKSLASVKLQQRMADATAYHEVQHLIDQGKSPGAENSVGKLQMPDWFETSLAAFGGSVANEKLREHILWELSAFFTHIAYAGEMQGVLLNDLTAITLNPMMQDQPHFYSIRILLPALHQLLEDRFELPIVPALSLGDIALAYKALAARIDELPAAAREARRLMLGNEVPELNVL